MEVISDLDKGIGVAWWDGFLSKWGMRLERSVAAASLWRSFAKTRNRVVAGREMGSRQVLVLAFVLVI